MDSEQNLIVFRIKELMTENNIAQKELASAIDVSESEITRIMRQKNIKISHKTIVAMCDYFNVSADYLLGRSNNRKSVGE